MLLYSNGAVWMEIPGCVILVPEVKREAGVNPARSRHCEWSVVLIRPLFN